MGLSFLYVDLFLVFISKRIIVNWFEKLQLELEEFMVYIQKEIELLNFFFYGE